MTFQHSCLPPDVAARLAADRDLVRGLRARIIRRIERDMMILDMLCPDADLEPDADAEDGGDAEPSLGSINPNLRGDPLTCGDGTNQLAWSAGGTDDREHGDDNGLGDLDGLQEQLSRFRLGGGNLRDRQEHCA